MSNNTQTQTRYRRPKFNLTYTNLQPSVGRTKGFWHTSASTDMPRISDLIDVMRHNSGNESTVQLLDVLDAAVVGVSSPYASYEVGPKNAARTLYADTYDQAKTLGDRPLSRRTVFVVLRNDPRRVWAFEVKNINSDAAAELGAQSAMLAQRYNLWAQGQGLRCDLPSCGFWFRIATKDPKNNVSTFVIEADRAKTDAAMQALHAIRASDDALRFLIDAQRKVKPIADIYFAWMTGTDPQPVAPQLPEAPPTPAHADAHAHTSAPAQDAPPPPPTPPAAPEATQPVTWEETIRGTVNAPPDVVPAAAPVLTADQRNDVNMLADAFTASMANMKPDVWKKNGAKLWDAVAPLANAAAELRGIGRRCKPRAEYPSGRAAIADLGGLIGDLIAYDIENE